MQRNDGMKVIVCVDDNNGMMFNNRRQSRDRVLIEDLLNTIKEGCLYIAPYSKILFQDITALIETETLLEEAGADDYCFVENKTLLPYSDRIDELIIYRWNRTYPADMHLDIRPEALSLKLVSTTEFAGSSHEKITKELYKK